MSFLISSLESFNQLLTASIAIMAFALLLYALAFNLRERVVRSFAMIMICVVIAFTCDAIASVTGSPSVLEFLLRLQWVGIAFLPPAYLQFSDAVLATTGKGSYGGWRWLIRFTYVISLCFLLTLPFSGLVGPLLPDGQPAPHLQRTPLSWWFTGYYGVAMAFSWANFRYASLRVVTSSGKRRMRYLLAGALAPALGSYPYLLFGSGFASQHPFFFWLMAAISNGFVFVLLVVMAYSVAFYGVAWPDRVVKLRLAKWLMRGPIAAIIVLGITTQVRRAGEHFGLAYSILVPITMAGTLLVTEYFLILYGRALSYRLFPVKDRDTMDLLQTVQDRLVTSADLQQFLEAVLAAACDRLQVQQAFVAALDNSHLEAIVSLPGSARTQVEDLQPMLEVVRQNGNSEPLFAWGNYWLIPLHSDNLDDEVPDVLLGLLAIQRLSTQGLSEEQRKALMIIGRRAAMALEDRRIQQLVFTSLQELAPQVDQIQRLRAAGRFNSEGVLEPPGNATWDNGELSKWVKDALTHYWGGPRLTESPLLQLQIVQQITLEHDGNAANALRALLRAAIERVRPEGERRFTGEWILYNILEMKFLEGHKVRDIAERLAMSEADLYRKQRVAIEAVAAVIVEMELKAWEQSVSRQQPAKSGQTIG